MDRTPDAQERRTVADGGPRVDPGPGASGRRGPRWSDVAPPAWLLRWGLGAACLLVLAGAVWLLAELISMLTLLVVSIVVALLLAGVLAPAVGRVVSRGVPRGVAAGLAVALVLLTLAGVLALLGVRLAEQLPQFRDQLGTATSELSSTLGVDVPNPLPGGSGGGSEGSGSGSGGSGGSDEGSGSSITDVLGSSVPIITDIFVGLFLVLVFLFLFIRNGRAMWGWVLDKLGGRLRDDVDAAAHAAWGTVGAYVRGLTVVAAFDAIGIGIGLLLLGVPLALTLAALQFVASYIPTIGSIAAGVLAVAVAFVSNGLGTALAVAALALAVQQVGNSVIEPYVMQRHLPLDAFTVLAAVTAGGLLWGIAGALLFVPLAAAVSAAGHELWTRRGRPPLAGDAGGVGHAA